MNSVIVFTKGSGVNALSILRSLGRRGIKTNLILKKGTQSLASRSSYCSRVLWIEEESPSALCQAISEVLKKETLPPVLICDSDETCYIASLCHSELRSKVLFFHPLENINELQDKREQMRHAKAAGIPIPQSWYPVKWEDFHKINPEKGRRLIVKPNPSYFTNSAPFKVLRFQTREDAEQHLKKIVSQPEGLIVQEFIEGTDENMWETVGYRSPNSQVTNLISLSKIKQSGTGAGGVAIICVKKRCPEIENLSTRYLAQAGYYGPFNIEFKYCRNTKEFVFIEANYRTARLNVIGRRTGADIPIIGYVDITGQAICDRKEFLNLDSVWLYDVRGCLETLRKTKELQSAVSMIKELAMAPLRSKEWLVHSPDDLKPTWYAWKDYTNKIVKGIIRKSKFLKN